MTIMTVSGYVIFTFSRLTMTVACSMNLYKFPMDDQQCSFKMESCKYFFKNTCPSYNNALIIIIIMIIIIIIIIILVII